MILYGSVYESPYTYSLNLADTASWRMLPALALPGSRQFATSAYDPDRDRMLLFGGVEYGRGVRADVWASSASKCRDSLHLVLVGNRRPLIFKAFFTLACSLRRYHCLDNHG